MKKAGGGSNKGASFERMICKQLSLWITEGKHPDAFWRSSSSGARSTISVKSGRGSIKNQDGDISATTKEGYLLLDHFTIECKHYNDLQVEGLLFSENPRIVEFWKQAKRDASRSNRIPLLIARQNFRPVVLGMPPYIYEWWRNLYLTSREFPSAVISTKHRVALMRFEQFLAAVHPSSLERINDNFPRNHHK